MNNQIKLTIADVQELPVIATEYLEKKRWGNLVLQVMEKDGDYYACERYCPGGDGDMELEDQYQVDVLGDGLVTLDQVVKKIVEVERWVPVERP